MMSHLVAIHARLHRAVIQVQLGEPPIGKLIAVAIVKGWKVFARCVLLDLQWVAAQVAS